MARKLLARAAAGKAALLLLASRGGPGNSGGAAEANGAATQNEASGASAAKIPDEQDRVRGLPAGQRNGRLLREIRDAKLSCQQVIDASPAQSSNQVPVYLATCQDGAVFAVAIADDGTARVRPVTPSGK